MGKSQFRTVRIALYPYREEGFVEPSLPRFTSRANQETDGDDGRRGVFLVFS